MTCAAACAIRGNLRLRLNRRVDQVPAITQRRHSSTHEKPTVHVYGGARDEPTLIRGKEGDQRTDL